MGTRTMSDETKAKIAASRAANKATKIPGEKRASLEDQLGAVQAAADSGDAGAQALLPVLDVYREKLTQAIADKKSSARKLRKLLSTLKE